MGQEREGIVRIAVVGAGGLGGFFGGLLARAGEDVTFIARGAHLEAIRARGLTVRSELAGDFTVRARATADVNEAGTVDLVLFGVKTYDLEAAANQIRPIVGRRTVVLPIQNGVDNAERIAHHLGTEPVLAGAAFVSSAIAAPGVIVQAAGSGKLLFGELSGELTARARQLLGAFRRAGIQAELRPDIRVVLWDKFLSICALSGLTALTRLPIGPILASAEGRAMCRETIAEVEAVGRASGVPLPAGCVEVAVARIEGLGPLARGSLSRDLDVGRRLELETLNGTVVRLGRELGVATPLNFAIYAALKPYADGAPSLPTPP